MQARKTAGKMRKKAKRKTKKHNFLNYLLLMTLLRIINLKGEEEEEGVVGRGEGGGER
jgi:hypothetical protein